MINIDDNDASTSTMHPIETEPVKITLNDCLACSGCVTTAESILIDQQSFHTLQQVLVDKVLHNNYFYAVCSNKQTECMYVAD